MKVHHLNCACIQRLSIHGRTLACHCLLIETPSSGLILVDTGLGSQDLIHPAQRLGFMFTYVYANPKRDPSLSAKAQIQALGYKPEDVRHIVMTHMDLDHVGGLSDFPQARIHLHATEWKAAMERKSIKAKHRYLPVMWEHKPTFETYTEEGEPWFGFESIRNLRGLPEEILLVPLFGHTLGHCGVAVQDAKGWLLHAGDAYFDPREIHGDKRRCAPLVGLFQAAVQTNRKDRLHNQTRLRQLASSNQNIRIFSAHNPFEFEEIKNLNPPSGN
ncbi:MBL fold metallo-hydrolase [Leptospira idonii]|uniref:MBL fold metallo-hydrolase n=1 Tax=Leptospira idonii TaxID=1193500 RepID=A0A4R9LUH7_9LEPT|nr:MBL fold metallo-hydrolase [Leptospira idonii]